ncbi:MAG: hypothetical protein JNK87_04655 [Bryobacterales bacterium]|nr:hypothetical protein [Bryobacterales bacterium]
MRSLLVLLAGLALAAQSPRPKPFGVGFVPKPAGQGDVTEDMLFRFVGEIPQVDRMFVINDSVHLLQTLVSLKNAGRPIDVLVLAGHGSRETPAITWNNDEQLPKELDLDWNRRENAAGKAFLADPSKVARSTRDFVQGVRNTVAQTDERIRLIPQLSGVMAPGASILMINCSAAASTKGVSWVMEIGNVLLGDAGGQITASTNDIVLREVSNIYAQIGQYLGNNGFKEWGAPLIRGNWVTYAIRARNPSAAASAKPAAPSAPVRPPSPNNRGSFGLTRVITGTAPPPAVGNDGSVFGSMTEDRFSVTAEWKGAYQGKLTVEHHYKRGSLRETLYTGDEIELQIVSLASESGRDKHNVGSSASWYIEGSAEVLEQGKTFAGRASDGKFYPASSNRVRFRVGSGGSIKIMAGHVGQLWGSSTNWNPVTYIYEFRQPATQKLGAVQ